MSFFLLERRILMTGKQIEKIRNEIPQFENGIPYKLTPEQKHYIEN